MYNKKREYSRREKGFGDPKQQKPANFKPAKK
jgi:hypothetical protein